MTAGLAWRPTVSDEAIAVLQERTARLERYAEQLAASSPREALAAAVHYYCGSPWELDA